MDVALLEQLVKLMAENGLSTIDLTDGDRRVTLKRGAETIALQPAAPLPYVAPIAGSALAAAPAAQSAAPNGAASADDEANLLKIKSPMVGTFYAAPAKGAKPYVNVGSAVDETTDVCIIEAMKNFNVHKAECRGTIAKILAQDGQPVDFGQVLFLVKPA